MPSIELRQSNWPISVSRFRFLNCPQVFFVSLSFLRCGVNRWTGWRSEMAFCRRSRFAGEKSQQMSISWVTQVQPWMTPAKPPTITKSTLALASLCSKLKKSLLTGVSLSTISLRCWARIDVVWYALCSFYWYWRWADLRQFHSPSLFESDPLVGIAP